MAKINIVIPVYNTKKYLRRAIRSILNQTFTDWKLILVNDGSSDGSEKICDDYAKKDSRITVLHQKNQGSLAARQNGVKLCDGDAYVCFLDSDDIYVKNAFALLYQTAVKTNADMVCADSTRYFHGIKMHTYSAPCFQEYREYSHEEIINELYISYFGITNLPPSLGSKLYKSHFIKKAMNNPGLVYFMGDDLSINIQVLPQLSKVVILPDIIYHYSTGGNTSRFMKTLLDDSLILYHTKREFATKYPMPQDAARLSAIELKNITYFWFLTYWKSGNFSRENFLQEIERVCNLPEIIDAVSFISNDKSGRQGFGELLAAKNYNGIFSMVEQDAKESSLKKYFLKILKHIKK